MDVSVIFKEKARHRQSLFHHGGIIPVCVCVCVVGVGGGGAAGCSDFCLLQGLGLFFWGSKFWILLFLGYRGFVNNFMGMPIWEGIIFGYIILHSYVLGCQFILWCFFYIKYSNIFWFMISKCFKNYNKAPSQIQREPFQEKTWVRGLRPGKTQTSLFSFER